MIIIMMIIIIMMVIIMMMIIIITIIICTIIIRIIIKVKKLFIPNLVEKSRWKPHKSVETTLI